MNDDQARRLKRLRRLAWAMDSAVRVPGTRWRVGLDSLIGIVPGVGDAAGLVVSLYILGEAWRLGVGGTTLARMAGNVAVDAVIGTVPLAGDLFDAGFRANRRNLRHVERALGVSPDRP